MEKPTIEMVMVNKLVIASPAFESNGLIPSKYTCDGENVSPPIRIDGLPEGTLSLVLIIDDPDAPMGTWDHWLVWNIPPTKIIEENTVPGTEGLNDFRKHTYGGPCPPSGTHRYFIKVYALNTQLVLSSTSKKREVERAMRGHILAQGELMGRYKRR